MKPIRKSAEDYLETIYNLSQTQGKVRSVDIADSLNVSKPSTHKAMQLLILEGLIEKESYGTVFLTDEGKRLAKEILKKHQAIKILLVDVLGVGEKTAEIDACKIEHSLSDETTQKLYEFLKSEFPDIVIV